jgi:hypothetical protein
VLRVLKVELENNSAVLALVALTAGESFALGVLGTPELGALRLHGGALGNGSAHAPA